MNEEQIERVRELVQIVADDDGTDFDTAFKVSMGVLKLHAIDNVPKAGSFAAGCGSQAKSSQADQVSD